MQFDFEPFYPLRGQIIVFQYFVCMWVSTCVTGLEEYVDVEKKNLTNGF